MKSMCKYLLILAAILCFQSEGFAQEIDYRPGLFLKEEWKETPAEIPLHQGHVNHPDLMPGGMSDACSRLDWIEVYAYLVRPRQVKTTN